MNAIWEEYWTLLEKANKQLTDYLNAPADNKLKKFVDLWNKLTKNAEKIDIHFQPALLPIEKDLPIAGSEFAEMWTRWKEYLQEQHGRVLRSRAEKSALELLAEWSGKDAESACFILRHAMAGGARNFYLVTKAQSNKPINENDTGSSFD